MRGEHLSKANPICIDYGKIKDFQQKTKQKYVEIVDLLRFYLILTKITIVLSFVKQLYGHSLIAIKSVIVLVLLQTDFSLSPPLCASHTHRRYWYVCVFVYASRTLCNWAERAGSHSDEICSNNICANKAAYFIKRPHFKANKMWNARLHTPFDRHNVMYSVR